MIQIKDRIAELETKFSDNDTELAKLLNIGQLAVLKQLLENEQQMPDSEKTDTFTEENNLLKSQLKIANKQLQKCYKNYSIKVSKLNELCSKCNPDDIGIIEKYINDEHIRYSEEIKELEKKVSILEKKCEAT